MTTLDLSPSACEDRLRNALLTITNYPERWDQETWGVTYAEPGTFRAALRNGRWPCNTAACLAGHGALAANLMDIGHPEHGSAYLSINPAGQQLIAENAAVSMGTPLEDDFHGLGQVIFGLDYAWARRLFRTSNTLAVLWELAEQVTEGRVSLPAELAERVATIDRVRELAESGDLVVSYAEGGAA